MRGDGQTAASARPETRVVRPETRGVDSMGDNVLIDQPAEGITRLTLNRPARLNALTRELVDEVHEALDAVDADHSCRVVILTGAGQGFCAGLDLNGFGEIPGTGELGLPQ